MMPVDSFKYLPRIITAYYKTSKRKPELPIPWTPLSGPVSECKFGLITSGGLFHKGVDPPFDLEREKKEPNWGDPSYRIIPIDIRQDEVGASHLHINTHDVQLDVNILLPFHRFRELAAEGVIGGIAENAYSFMGYQGFPPDPSAWQETYGPEVAAKLKVEDVNCVLLTPA
jgi:D-proline reductase (dithiol) PrdB